MSVGVSGPALVRLLARWAGAEVPASRLQFAQRLGQWLGWADAISLYSALGPPPAAERPPAARGATLQAARADAERVRAQLAQAIAETPAAIADETDASAPPDLAAYRRHYQARQNAMDKAVTALRERLRRQLAAGSPAMARLAEVDAVMAQVLAPQEQRLLATVPGWLGRHAEQLQRAGAPEAAHEGRAALNTALNGEMTAALTAELDLRFQPVQGLLAALGAGAAAGGDAASPT